MRDLNECKAEIFRLSEKKIRQRKKQRAIALGTGIPVCLCALVILSATVAGHRFAMSKSDNFCTPESALLQDAQMAPTARKEYTVTDPDTADAVLELLGVVTMGKPDLILRDEQADKSEANYSCPAGAYRIRLALSGGTEAVYLVNGQQVWDLDSGELITISAQNAARLTELLEAE